ncbi:MAG: thioredoxin [Prevotella sp.]|jgi:thioredoxin 1|nr:thioredoxin [Prevotella sp.]MCI1281525.1 thioredoxin [Prevotella sp.]
MRQLLFLTTVLLSIITSSCSHQPKPADNSKAVKQESTTVKPTELTAALFKQKIMDYEANPNEWKFKGERPAIVDFYATWCGPCKMTAPVLDSLAIEYAGRVDFYKVDVDKQPELASTFGIQSIPALMFIPKEGQPRMSVGAMMRPELEKAIQEILPKENSNIAKQKH